MRPSTTIEVVISSALFLALGLVVVMCLICFLSDGGGCD